MLGRRTLAQTNLGKREVSIHSASSVPSDASTEFAIIDESSECTFRSKTRRRQVKRPENDVSFMSQLTRSLNNLLDHTILIAAAKPRFSFSLSLCDQPLYAFHFLSVHPHNDKVLGSTQVRQATTLGTALCYSLVPLSQVSLHLYTSIELLNDLNEQLR